MTRYYELEDGDVIHSVPTGGTEDDADRIWVRQGADARLEHLRPTRAEVKPDLLSGQIVQQYVQGQAPPVVYGPPQYVQPPPPGSGGGRASRTTEAAEEAGSPAAAPSRALALPVRRR